jgi:excisionase family DNA binding protein
MEPLLHPMDKAAAALGISRRTAYELVKRGELRTVLIGRRRLVSSEALREYAAGLTASHSTAA